MFLKQHGLRNMSLPLDWVFSNIEMAAHCIEDDFRMFRHTRHQQHCLSYEQLAEAVDMPGFLGALVSGASWPSRA